MTGTDDQEKSSIEFSGAPKTEACSDDLRPGCYGVPFIYKPEAVECRGCPLAADCGPASLATMAELEARCRPVLVAKAEAKVAARRASDRVRQAKSRAEKAHRPPDPAALVTPDLLAQRHERERQLTAFLGSHGAERQYRKLKGRAGEVADVWLARQLATAAMPPGRPDAAPKLPSAAKVAEALQAVPGAVSRDRFSVGRDMEWLEVLEVEVWRHRQPVPEPAP